MEILRYFEFNMNLIKKKKNFLYSSLKSSSIVFYNNPFVFQKLRIKYSTNPEQFRTLQDMVEAEIEKGTTQAKNSSTDALLWLKR